MTAGRNLIDKQKGILDERCALVSGADGQLIFVGRILYLREIFFALKTPFLTTGLLTAFAFLNNLAAQENTRLIKPDASHAISNSKQMPPLWNADPVRNTFNMRSSPEAFLLDSFTNSVVYFKDDTRAEVKLNYNLFYQEMNFITSNGDTLAVADEAAIKYIVIGKHTFYYDNGYLELIGGYAKIKLAKQEFLKIESKKEFGGKENRRFIKETTYYIGDEFNHFLKATKKNLLQMFGKNQAPLEKYIDENNTRFYEQEDLMRLMEFIHSL